MMGGGKSPRASQVRARLTAVHNHAETLICVPLSHAAHLPLCHVCRILQFYHQQNEKYHAIMRLDYGSVLHGIGHSLRALVDVEQLTGAIVQRKKRKQIDDVVPPTTPYTAESGNWRA